MNSPQTDRLASRTNGLTDLLGRTARYMRLSLTDRCNLRCLYCRSDNETFIPHANILRYEEMMELVALAVRHGVEKVRITGGEPFVRKGCMAFLENLRARYPLLNIRLTTNGTLIAPYINGLRDLGINAVNLSLDTFDRARFVAITGIDAFDRVRATLDRLLQSGIPLKINAVAMRGVNDGELGDFLRFAHEHPVDVRFIEFMPMGEGTRWTHDRFWSAVDILREANHIMPLTEIVPVRGYAPKTLHSEYSERDNAGPARLYDLQGAGRFGLITPLTNHFCMQCNRLRITSDGRLRTCLFDDHEYRLREVLRHPHLGIGAAERIMQAAMRNKPVGAQLLEARSCAKIAAVADKRMNVIGG